MAAFSIPDDKPLPRIHKGESGWLIESSGPQRLCLHGHTTTCHPEAAAEGSLTTDPMCQGSSVRSSQAESITVREILRFAQNEMVADASAIPRLTGPCRLA